MRKKMVIIEALVLTLAVVALPIMTKAQVMSATVKVDGMSCPFCTYGVEKRLKKVEGVKSVSIDLKSGIATLTAVEDGSLSLSQIPVAVKKAGFTPGEIKATFLGVVQKDPKGRFVLESGKTGKKYILIGFNELSGKELQKFSKTSTPVEVTGIFQGKLEDLPELKPIDIRGVTR